MKNKITIAILILGTTTLFAQQADSSLVLKIEKLDQNIINLQHDVIKNSSELKKDYWTYRGVKKETQDKITQQKNTIDSLNSLIDESNQKLMNINNNLDSKIKQTGDSAYSKITELGDTLDENRLYWIIASLGTLLLGAFMYLFLGKRIKSSKTDVETQIKNTNKNIEEESVKLDNKLVEILETQLKVKQEESKVQPTTSNKKEDHSLVLKVADEVIRIQKNLSRMDEKTKGLKHLRHSVISIMDNLAANGYELVEMLGKEYNDGIKGEANFIQDEDFEEGKRIITRIIKPQVNFNGTMIQAAQFEVTEA